MSEIKPHHRRAAAEALELLHPDDCAQWIETGTFATVVTRTPAYEAGSFAVYDRAAQAIADAEERGRPQWQPIAMAPTDGTRVLGCTADGLVRVYFYIEHTRSHPGGFWTHDAGRGEPYQLPAAWMPLPCPPGRAALEPKP